MLTSSRFIFRLVCSLLLCASMTLSYGQGASDALMRLLKSDRLPPERLPGVVEIISKRGNAEDLGFIFEQVTNEDGWSGDVVLTALKGLADAAESRKVKPNADLSRLAVLFERKGTSLEVREQAVRLAGLWQVPELAAPLQVVAVSVETAPELRAAAISALARFGEIGHKTIETLASSDKSIAVRAPAIAALATFDLKAAADRAASAMASAKATDDLGLLLGAFLQRQEGSEALAGSLRDVKISKQVAQASLRYMYSIGRSDAALSSALGKAAGIAMEDKSFSPEEIHEMSEAVLKEGNPALGETVFRRADLSCVKCHSVSGAGGNIGPDLSAIGPSNPIDYLLTSILEPDAAIKEHYATQIIITSDGLVVTGIVADENENGLVLRTAEGKDQTIAKADVEARESGGSLMPKGLVKFMTRQELLDLVRFLSELGKPGTDYAIRSAPTIQRWRLLTDVPATFQGSIPPESEFREALPESDAPIWKAVYSQVNGVLPLSELTAGSEKPVYLLAEIDVRQSGAVGIRFDSTEGIELWVNGDHIDNLSPRFATEFPEGRQTIVIRVDPAARPTRTLRVELFRPEGSSASAEAVGGS